MIARWQRHWHEVWNSFPVRKQIAVTAAAGGAVLVLLAWPIMQIWGRPRLREWRVERTMDQAAAFAAQHDYRNLLLSIRRASQLGSRDLDVWRRIAETMTKLGSPEAVTARQTVTALAPDDLVARVELAQAALLFGDYKLSQSSLDAATRLAESSATYQQAAATLALYLGDVTTLKSNLAALVETDPSNHEAAFDLAAARLWSRDATERERGLDAMLELLRTPAFRVRTALELLKDAARTQDSDQLATVLPSILAVLDQPPGSTLQDHDLPRLLLGLKTTAAPIPADVARVADWMAEVRQGRDALQWIHSLPDAVSHTPKVAEIAAEIAVRENLPEAIVYYLLNNSLGQLPAQAAVLVAGARVLEDNNRLAAAQAAWDEALQISIAAREPDALRVLARVATLWDHPDWAERALAAAIERNPDSFWAYAGLRDLLIRRHAPNELWELYQNWIQRQPDDLTVVIQWLRLGMALPFTGDEVERRAPALLHQLPRSPRVDAALAALHHWRGDNESAQRYLNLAGEAIYTEPDSAYWAALLNHPAAPNETYPALARLLLLPIERDQITTNPDVTVGLLPERLPSAAPDLRVR